MKTLVIMPTYNEAASIELTLGPLLENYPELDVLVVDDGSPDGTGNIVKGLMSRFPQIELIERSGKQGLGSAYLMGFEYGQENGYELIVEMDADGSHRQEDLAKIISAAKDSDLVIGSRWIPGGAVENWSPLRKAISRFGNWFASRMLSSEVRDLTAGFRAYNSNLLAKLPLERVQAQGYGFQIEMTWRSELAGASITEVPILFVERTWGVSKMSTGIVLEALLLITFWGIRKRINKNFTKSF